MREIKFRIWQAGTSCFLGHGKEDSRVFSLLDWVAYYEGFGRYCNNYPSYVFQQWTGLKDKHGREIYEGDILRGTMSDFNCYQVFSVQFDVEQGGYRWYEWSLDSLEVIGNIFESPELLEKHD